MAKYKCKICGYIYDEEKEGKLFTELDDNWTCKACGAPKHLFEKLEEKVNEKITVKKDDNFLEYDLNLKKDSSEFEKNMNFIHEISVTNKSIIEPMNTSLKVIDWTDILILGASLKHSPLNDDEDVSTKTIIGKHSKKPMVLESPIYISHMSFGALSKEVKIALAKGSKMAKTAIGSGEGGILEEEINNSYKYIFEYVPNLYSVTDENLMKADAIEIKIGQGTKPGMGGHLPGEKVTSEIAKVRGKEIGKDIHSPSKFSNINSKEDLKNLVSDLRKRSLGRPIGIKIAAGHIEQDLEWIGYAGVDFVTIDGRGGATASSLKVLKDSASIPTVFALYKARKYLDEHNLDIDLIITGGLRISSDFAKALAMGADAIALSSSVLMAASCQQYRQCHNDKCPMGIATQDKKLRQNFDIEKSSIRIFNFLNVSNEELKMFGRITGHDNIHDLNIDDIVTTNHEISDYTNIKHV